MISLLNALQDEIDEGLVELRKAVSRIEDPLAAARWAYLFDDEELPPIDDASMRDLEKQRVQELIASAMSGDWNEDE